MQLTAHLGALHVLGRFEPIDFIDLIAAGERQLNDWVDGLFQRGQLDATNQRVIDGQRHQRERLIR